MKTIPHNKDYRITLQRKIVLEELRKVCSHPTAKQLHLMTKKRNSNISLATIYRSLDFLEKQKLIIKLQSKDKEARYDGNPEKHCHLCCDECNCVQDVFDVEDVKIKSKQLNKSGFVPNFNFLELHGLCKSCLS
ncbi:transcriptional repressor [Candidatus Gracilibacteria bacterium]|nr:transcriptional repressor [Candidatus Gracilibacteria bacterium]